MAWGADPSDYAAHQVVWFSQGGIGKMEGNVIQFPWMSLKIAGQEPVVRAGCCVAFTVFFFDYYRIHGGDNMGGYFRWVQKPRGIASVMNLQTKYKGWRTGQLGTPLSDATPTITSILNALRRKVEDQTFADFGFENEDSPWMPCRVAKLAAQVTQPHASHGPMFKPIYLANTSVAHAFGAILDDANTTYIFFDPNHGMACFLQAKHLRDWLEAVSADYMREWPGLSAFFCDTKQAQQNWRRPNWLQNIYG